MFNRYNQLFQEFKNKGYGEKEIDKGIFYHILKEDSKNILFYGLATYAILILSNISWWLSVILTGLFAIIVIFDILSTAFTTILFLLHTIFRPLFYLSKEVREEIKKVEAGSYPYKLGGQFFRLIEATILFSYIIFLVYKLKVF